MQECSLPYIPVRLHQQNKLNINQFEVGEFLYRRCNELELENPFATITLTELSHNRGGFNENILCNPEDVLFSIREEEEFEKYDKVVCSLRIRDLNKDNGYKKEYNEVKNNQTISCTIELFHEPEPCMYPHCVFRIKLGDVIVIFDNNKQTLKNYNIIRNSLREELASMIVKRQVSQNDNP